MCVDWCDDPQSLRAPHTLRSSEQNPGADSPGTAARPVPCEAHFSVCMHTCRLVPMVNQGGNKHLNHSVFCIGALVTFRGWSHRDPVCLVFASGSPGSVSTLSILA